MARPRRDPFGLRPSRVDVDGRPVRSLSAGKVTGLPEVVLLPGLGACGYLVPWTRRTAAWTRATLLDLPGWQAGRPPSCPPTVEGVAAAVARWLEVGDRRDVVLLGHSSGAQAVLHAALLVPGRVAGVVLAGPTFDPAARALPRLLVRALTTVPRESLGTAAAAVPWYLRSGGLPLVRFVRSALADRPEDLVPTLEVPVLVLGGRHDGFAPPAWVRRLAGLAGAPCHVLPGAHAAPFPYAAAADALVHGAVRAWSAASPGGGRVPDR